MSNDMLKTIEPKSDQMNSDDLIGGRTVTIKITKVSILAGDQPVAIHYEGDNGKPYKPSKGMRRVLVNVWGPDANNYTGRRLTLYRDDKVTFGALAVGGIRISHMSDISEPVTLALTATRANKKPFTVMPLTGGAAAAPAALKDSLIAAANSGMGSLEAAFKALTTADKKSALPFMDELKGIAAKVEAMSDAEKELLDDGER